MLVNLFDFNFRQSVCSVAYQTPEHIQYVRDLTTFDGVTIFTDGYITDGSVDRVRSRYKIAWLHEPYCLHPDTYQAALLNAHKFDLVLTYYQPYLDLGRNFRFCPYAGTWIDKKDWGIKPKTKLCSMLIGSKMSTDGHRIRHDIANMIDREGYPVDFYGSRGTPVGYGQDTKYKVLADYAFSICTETCYEENLFTEWLLDCFALGTIPIYWGCPNLEYYRFNRHGLFSIACLSDVSVVLGVASMEFHTKRIQFIYNNLLAMRQYAVTEDWLYLNVLKGFE